VPATQSDGVFVSHRLLKLTSTLLVAAFLAAPLSSWATETAQLKLPPNPWGCQNCHGAADVTPDTVSGTSIVPFTNLGLAWIAQSASEAQRLWSDLAVGNADGDGCSNGYELGDPSGSWLPEQAPGVDKSTGDPNLHDCTLPISEESWSRLKALFDND